MRSGWEAWLEAAEVERTGWTHFRMRSTAHGEIVHWKHSKRGVWLWVGRSTVPGAGKGLFAARDMAEGEILGKLWGALAESGDGSDRVVFVRVRGRDVRVNVTGCLFEWANSSLDEGSENMHVYPGGCVRVGGGGVRAGQELLWYYADPEYVRIHGMSHSFAGPQQRIQ